MWPEASALLIVIFLIVATLLLIRLLVFGYSTDTKLSSVDGAIDDVDRKASKTRTRVSDLARDLEGQVRRLDDIAVLAASIKQDLEALKTSGTGGASSSSSSEINASIAGLQQRLAAVERDTASLKNYRIQSRERINTIWSNLWGSQTLTWESFATEPFVEQSRLDEVEQDLSKLDTSINKITQDVAALAQKVEEGPKVVSSDGTVAGNAVQAAAIASIQSKVQTLERNWTELRRDNRFVVSGELCVDNVCVSGKTLSDLNALPARIARIESSMAAAAAAAQSSSGSTVVVAAPPNAAVTALETKVGEADDKIRNIQTDLSALRQNQGAVSSALDMLKAQDDAGTRQVQAELRDWRAESGDQIVSLQNELLKLRDSVVNQDDSMPSKMIELQESVRKDIDALRTTVSSQTSQTSQVQTEVKGVQTRIVDMDSQIQRIQTTLNKSPAASIPTKSGIGVEDLYTWFADAQIVNAANGRTLPKEPFWKVFESSTSSTTLFTRLSTVGSASFNTYYFTNLWNRQYMIEMNAMQQEIAANLNTRQAGVFNDIPVPNPANYVLMSLPVKPGVAHSMFFKIIAWDRWSIPAIYVTTKNRDAFYRLQAKTNSYQDVHPSTSWIDPNGDMSASHMHHEWLMYCVPQYVVDKFSFDESRDPKSKYKKNIQFCVMTGIGNGNGGTLSVSGIAMRPNPHSVTFASALELHWATNGGSGVGWHSHNWNHESMIQMNANTNYNNIRVPISPVLDPAQNKMPDFYLVGISHNEMYQDQLGFIFLQNPADVNDVEPLGRFSKGVRGRYGQRLVEQHRHAMGLIVPSPDRRFVIYLGGRPYLNIRYDNNLFGSGWNGHLRGMFTEVIDDAGPNPLYTPYLSV